jgi:serine/threonine-protein kinase
MRSLGEIKPGQSIGRYEFLVPIAEGGMASVWAARMKGTRGFQKTMAIKMMLSSLSDNPQFEQMFLDEAQIASRIHHPNVVEIFDLGEETEVLYIAMEYIDGEPLSTIFRTAQKKGGIPLPIAVRIISDACAGLNAAHDLVDDNGSLVGLVHRDVSPQNILVSYDGTVKIVDFGVALAETRSSEKTMAGTVKGKAPYMSPEQALGKPIDCRTDIFALGIVLFHLTTGKHPFRAENDILTLHNIIESEPPKPSSLVPSYPRPLEAAVLKALEKTPEKRFQTMAEFEAALDRVMPPTAARIRPADVGRFVREIVGDRGEKRRDALRAAVRLADERLQNDLDAAKLASKPMAEIGLTASIGALSVSGVRSQTYQTSIDSLTTQTGQQAAMSTSTAMQALLNGPASAPPTRSDLPAFINGPPSSSGSQPSITAIGAPGMTASTPPPDPGTATKSGARRSLPFVAGGLALAHTAVIVAVVSSSKNHAASNGAAAIHTAAASAAPTTPPAVSAVTSAQVTAPVVASAVPDSIPVPPPSATAASGVVDPSTLPSDTKHPGGPFVGGPGKKVVVGKTPEKIDKPEKTPDKPKATSGGFVPPPLNDPGF